MEGIISGIPEELGSTLIHVSASNVTGTGKGVLVIVVQSLPPAVEDAVVYAHVGEAVSFQIACSRPANLFAAGILPPGLVLDAATGVITGIPEEIGVTEVQVEAANASGRGTGIVVFVVRSHPPEIADGIVAAGRVGVRFELVIDAAYAPTTYTSTGLPSGLVCDPRTGVISGRPEESGDFLVVLGASNDGGSAAATLQLTISPRSSSDGPGSGGCGLGSSIGIVLGSLMLGLVRGRRR